MRVVRYHAAGDIRIEHADEPLVRPGELKLRVRNCSMCGTDVKIFRHGHYHIRAPRTMGHEIAGEISDVGDAVRGFAVGDRVQVIAAIPCGICDACRKGWMTVCPNQESMGYHYDGGFADFMIVPSKVLAMDGVNRVPEGLSFAEASLAEPLACVLNGQELAGVHDGDVVVVVGAGPIGCLHVRLARARGADKVFLIDINRTRLEAASARVQPDESICGEAVDVVDAVTRLTDGWGADVIITAVASGMAQQQAMAMAAPRGRVSLFGGLPKDSPVISCDANRIHYRELTVVGASGSSPAHNREAISLIARGTVPVLDLITHRLGLGQALEALELVARGEALKVTIEP